MNRIPIFTKNKSSLDFIFGSAYILNIELKKIKNFSNKS